MNKTKNIALVLKNAAAIKDIKKPDLETCMAALMQDGALIEFIDTASFTRREYFNLCYAAVKSNPKVLPLIQRDRLGGKLWDSVMFTAVRNNGLALRWIKEQSPELCLEAVKQNPQAFAFVDKTMCDAINPHCYTLLQEAAQGTAQSAAGKNKPARKTKKSGKAKNQEPAIDLRDVERQTEDICLKAVMRDGLQIQYVHRQTRKLCRAAIRQNPEADNYIRDSNMVWLDDLLGNACSGMGEFASVLGDYVFYSISKNTKKVPVMLKVKGKQCSPSQYYSLCQEALEDTFCNIRHVNPALLSAGQYRELCMAAIKEMPDVMVFINEADIDADLYFQICLQMLGSVVELKRAFKKIQSSRLSTDQYYRLTQTFLEASQHTAPRSIETIDAKKLTGKQYFDICKKVLEKIPHDFENMQSGLLTRSQYTELAFSVVKKNHANIDKVDRNRLAKKDWLELCKIAVAKKGSFLYYLDIPSGKDFNVLLEIAGKNGGGLKYAASQNFSHCFAVVKKDGNELEYVRPEQFTQKQYLAICKAALKKEPRAIGFVVDDALDNDQYLELCTAAQKSFYGIFDSVNREKIPASLYHSWCRTALGHSPLWISDIPFSKHYFHFCLKAVKKDGNVLKDIKYLRFTPEQYAAVRKAAEETIKKNTTDEDDELSRLFGQGTGVNKDGERTGISNTRKVPGFSRPQIRSVKTKTNKER